MVLAFCLALLSLSVPLKADPAQEWLYTVRPGDNLWDITEAHLTHLRYVEKLQALNAIEDPHYIPPGTRLRIPLDWVRLEIADAEVVAVHGQVSAMRRGHQIPEPVTERHRLRMGDTLATGPDGSATVEFGDGSRMLVEPDSQVTFDLLQAYGKSGFVDTRVRLKSGRTEHRARPRGPGPRYEIITPAAITAVRGTRYRVGSAEDGTTASAEVLEGRINLATEQSARSIKDGFGVVARRGAPLPKPRPLLPAPDLPDDLGIYRRVPFNLTLVAVPGATAYRIQVAPSERFQTLLVDQVSQSTKVLDMHLPDGEFVLRLRGIDDEGLEGKDAVTKVTVDARPEPPIAIEPSDARVLSPGEVTLRWSEPTGAASYRVQVANDPSFVSLVVDEPAWGDTNFAFSADLPPATYYWRLATIDSQGEQGPFGDHQRFKRLAEAPAVEPPNVDEDFVSFRWMAARPNDRYELQVAKDPGFEDPVASVIVDEPSYRIPRPPAGIYFLRVRTIDSDGDAGPFATTQRLNVPPSSYWPLLVPPLFMLLVI